MGGKGALAPARTSTAARAEGVGLPYGHILLLLLWHWKRPRFHDSKLPLWTRER